MCVVPTHTYLRMHTDLDIRKHLVFNRWFLQFTTCWYHFNNLSRTKKKIYVLLLLSLFPLHYRKLRANEVTSLAKGHTASCQQSCMEEPGFFADHTTHHTPLCVTQKMQGAPQPLFSSENLRSGGDRCHCQPSFSSFCLDAT